MAVQPEMLMCKGHNNPLLKCSGRKQAKEFYRSRSEFAYFPEGLKKSSDIGYVPYCKDCVQKIFEHYYENGSAFDCAVYYTCQKLDIPFITKLYEEILTEKRSNEDFKNLSKNYMGKYIAKLNLARVAYGAKLDFSYSDSDLSQLDQKIEERETRKNIVKELIEEWGKQENEEYYEFLQKEFIKVTEGVEFINQAQRETYKDYCRDRLILRRMNDEEYKGDETIDKVRQRVSKTMSDLKINNFETIKPKTLAEQTLFEKIRLIDEKNVKDIYKDVRKDYDINKLKYYDELFSLRPLGNMLLEKQDFNINLDDLERYNMNE